MTYPHDPPGQPGESPWPGRTAVLDLADLPAIVSPLPAGLRGATVAVSYRPECPYCDGPMASLLSGCDKPDCRRAELDADRYFERLADV